ncbi:MAG: DUF4384 domain-containing protein [Acidobacteriota bacterium]|nr:DUF4384 domain-containing protein [Acidobacteriota bacterium]
MKPILFFLLMSCSLPAQDSAPPSAQSPRIEIALERQEDDAWKTVDPGFVFEPGDRVRFRFRANFDGYLYVMDYGTSGSYSLLFPLEETGRDNKIAYGKEYRVPATQAWFRIAGPPGHDIVYWMVTPLVLAEADGGRIPPALPKSRQPSKILLPRCDDSIFRARGECVDSSAGLRPIQEAEELPENLRRVPRLNSRELIILRKDDVSTISSPAPLTGPVIYQFKLAHK